MKNDLISGRTPEEIKKWLNCLAFNCEYDMCGECEYDELCKYPGTALLYAPNALALINRLESERNAALAKVSKWISVEEQEVPAENGTYLCTGYWIGSGRKQTETADYIGEWKIANNFVLTHWMPLPEPPKEDA